MKIKWTLFFVLGFALTGFAQDSDPVADPGDNFQGLIGVYSPQMEGKKTSSGEIYSGNQLTAAHAVLPFGTKLRVTNFSNGKSATLIVNDRIPSGQGRVLKVSSSAADVLGFSKDGVAYARVDVLGREALSSQPPKVEAQMSDDQMSAKVTPQETPNSVEEDTSQPQVSGDGAEQDTTAVRPVVPEKTDIQGPQGSPINVNRIFVIQFGAFSTPKKASEYQKELKKQGITTYYSKEGKAGSELYKVRESKIYRDLQEVLAKVLDYKKQGLDCFAVGKFFVAKENS